MNRNPIKQWAVTFPQSGGVTRKEFADSFPPSSETICAQEKHEDGGNHLHLGIKLLKGISKAKLLKWVGTKWPNDFKRIHLQPTKDTKNWGNYCMKEDPECYAVKVITERKKKYTEADALNDINQDILDEIQLRKEAEKNTRIFNNACEDCPVREDDIRFMFGVSKPAFVLENNM